MAQGVQQWLSHAGEVEDPVTTQKVELGAPRPRFGAEGSEERWRAARAQSTSEAWSCVLIAGKESVEAAAMGQMNLQQEKANRQKQGPLLPSLIWVVLRTCPQI